MIQLYQFAAAWGMPSGSPFCTKLHAYFRMADVDYEPVNIGDPRKAPKGKVPYIADDGTTISDSGDIVDHIEATRSPGLLPTDPGARW